MNVHRQRSLLDKLKTLSPEKLAEVEDFIDFLRAREGDATLVGEASRASQAAFAAVWDNAADAAYDKL